MENKLTRKERDFIRHKAEIMKSAEDLFAESGYYNVTMDMVAKESEYSKGSLYNYFESKDVLLFEILNSKMDFFLAELTKVVGESLTLKDKVNALVEFYFDYFSENIGFFKIADTEKYNLTKFTQKKMMITLRAKYIHFTNKIRKILAFGNQKSEKELILLASAISGVLNSLLTRNLMYKEKIEIEIFKEFAKSKIIKLIE